MRSRRPLVILASWTVIACGTETGPAAVDTGDEPTGSSLTCSIPHDLLVPTGIPEDGIPALSDPPLVAADGPGLDYLSDDDRIVGFEIDGTYVAVPHNILWTHQIVNLNTLKMPLTVSYSPFTGSSLVFERGSVSNVEFGVSEFVFLNNLVMFERKEKSSLWPQMLREARCGSHNGTFLDMYPAVEMRWGAWRQFHPETLVVSGETGHETDYAEYPFGQYEEPDNAVTRYPHGPIDARRPPKERVLGFPPVVYDGEVIGGAIAFPFQELEKGPARQVIRERARGRPVVVFWDRDAQFAVAFRPTYGGSNIDLEMRGDLIVDVLTESVWNLEGTAISGELAGEQLELIPEAHIAFWFAWATFTPSTEIWEYEEG